MGSSNMDKKSMEDTKTMKLNTLALSKIINFQEKENFSSKSQMKFMKVKYLMVICMVKAKSFTLMEIFMKDIFQMVFIMEKEFIIGQVVKFIKVRIKKE